MTPQGDQVCYRDAYARELEARVVEVALVDGGAPQVVLDATVFYPGGGGQPSDVGALLRTADPVRRQQAVLAHQAPDPSGSGADPGMAQPCPDLAVALAMQA